MLEMAIVFIVVGLAVMDGPPPPKKKKGNKSG
jgi:hypothetical protein